MRVYLPSTLAELARAWADGSVGAPGGVGYAVTPALREWYATADLEELEYAAAQAAARASLGLLDGASGAPARRVVVAVEVDRVVPRPDAGVAAVGFEAPVPLADVAAVLVDEPAAQPVVSAAAAAIRDADRGDSDAVFTVDEAVARELLWYAAQEVPALLAEV